MVVADDPAPPRDVQQGRARPGVLEVDERGDLPVRPMTTLTGAKSPWTNVIDRRCVDGGVDPLGRRPAQVDVGQVDGSQPTRQPAHPVGEVARPIGIAEPARPRLAVDPGREQPSDHAAVSTMVGAGTGMPASASRVMSRPIRSTRALGSPAANCRAANRTAVGQRQPMGGAGVSPADGLGCPEPRPEPVGDLVELPVTDLVRAACRDHDGSAAPRRAPGRGGR